MKLLLLNVMRPYLFFFILQFFFALRIYSQIIPPYSTSFETNDPSWSHYPAANNGIDDWQRGSANNNYAEPKTGNFAWCTNVNGYFSPIYYFLETPAFNLSDTNNTYVISFNHKHNLPVSNNSRGAVEFSIDSGATWNTLSIASANEKENWHTYQSFYEGFFNTSANYKRARASLFSLRGNADVRFRFSFVSQTSGSFYGWIIDDFEIKNLQKPDIIALGGSITTGEPSNKLTFPISLNYMLNEEFQSYSGKTYIYYSTDNVLDVSDILLDSLTNNFQISSFPFSYTVNNTGFIQAGLNYIIYDFDVDAQIDELNESNNIGYAIIDAEAVYSMPYVDDFETINPFITEYSNVNDDCNNPFVRGKGEHQILSGTHSGNNAWYTENPNPEVPQNCNRALEFPFMDLVGNHVLHFFYKNRRSQSISLERMFYSGSNSYWTSMGGVPNSGNKGWAYYSTTLNSSWGPVFKCKFKFSSTSTVAGFILDDIYMGPSAADLLIPVDETIRYTTTNIATDTLYYNLLNCGTENALTTVTKFYLSSDSIFDIGDVFLGQNNEAVISSTTEELRSFYYNKPNQIPGEYFIIAKVDADSTLIEMRETNNVRVFKIYQRSLITAPYFNDFETSINEWYHFSDYKTDALFWGNTVTNFSGISGKAFGSDSIIKPISDTRTLLYTPIFDLSNLTNPVLMFDLAYQRYEHALGYYNAMRGSNLYIDYSVDGGATWIVLDTTNQSFKRWYYKTEGLSYNQNNTTTTYRDYEPDFPPNYSDMGRDDDNTENCILDLSFLKNYNQVQFRYIYGVDYQYGLDNRYGDVKLYIDNFEIKEAEIDLTIDYVKDLYISPLTTEIELEYHIRNLGNYISSPTTVNFYLSADSLLDVSDISIGTNLGIKSVPPDQRKWFANLLTIPGGALIGKNYLLFEIDNSNIVAESDESNNISFYRLNQGGVQNYAYLEDFNNYQVHGWRSYNYNSGSINLFPYRYTNRIYHDELINTYKRDGQMNLDRINGISTYYPHMYLESPSYNLTNMDSVFISFNYSISTNETSNSTQEGGNLEYSADGGQSWNVLGTYNDTNGVNWYNKQITGMLNNEPSWYNCNPEFKTAIYNATSLLAYSSDITFRFKLKAKQECFYPGPAGFKMDNFRISETRPFVDLIATQFGDTIEFKNHRPSYPNMDSIALSAYNQGDLIVTSNVQFRWSTDSIYDGGDLDAGLLPFNSALNNDTFSLIGMLTYPSTFCDSTLYLVYHINPDLGNPLQPWSVSSQVYELDTTNNEGYFVVNLIDHYLVLGSQTLNYVTDTTICDGDSLILQPIGGNNWQFNWSNGSTNNTLTVKDSGTYWVDIVSTYGCLSTTNQINIQFYYNNVDIINGDSTIFCAGDSVNLYITEEGIPSWSSTFQNDSSIFVYGGNEYWVSLLNSNGCISSDTVILAMEFNDQPLLSASDTVHFCKNVATIEALQSYNQYSWNTGDTTRVISIENNGTYYLQINNTCGSQFSDTIFANFYNLIDSITPSNNVIGCSMDTINFQTVVNGAPTVNWNYNQYGTGTKTNIYIEPFNYTGPLYPNIPIVPWQVVSNDNMYLSKVTTGSGNLEVNPTGDSIIFITDIIDISDYFDIDIELQLSNLLTDSVYVYYEIDNGPRKRFNINGAFSSNSSVLASQYIYSASTLKITVVFNGTSTFPSQNQLLKDIVVKGYQKQYSSFIQSGNSYNHIIMGDSYLLITANNGFCVQEEIVTVKASTVNQLYNSTYWVCPNTDYTVCPSGVFPIGYNVSWDSSPYIISSPDSCAIINIPVDTVISVNTINEIGCERQDQLYLYLTTIDTALNFNGTQLYTFESGTYLWLDCDSNYSLISGETGSSFTPTQNGSYAVQIIKNGCLDTSECMLVCINSINTTVSVVNNVLTSNEVGATYQWLDCNGSVPISGETGQSFTPTVNGSYAVIVNQGNCSDTSLCYIINGVSITENEFGSDFHAFPNPTKDILNIELGKLYSLGDIVIKNVLGEIIHSSKFKNTNTAEISLATLSNGIYFLHLYADDKKVVIKIIKD